MYLTREKNAKKKKWNLLTIFPFDWEARITGNKARLFFNRLKDMGKLIFISI